MIHHRPDTGLQGKFSIEYAAVTALLDEYQGFSSFTDEAVRRPEVRRLLELVEVQLGAGGDWLLAGELEAEVYAGAEVLHVREHFPPGAPQRPPTHAELMEKARDCLAGTTVDPKAVDWSTASRILRDHI